MLHLPGRDSAGGVCGAPAPFAGGRSSCHDRDGDGQHRPSRAPKCRSMAKRGGSPLSLALAAGAHTLVVRANGESRTIPINIAAGAEVSQYLDMPKAGSTSVSCRFGLSLPVHASASTARRSEKLP